ncbi:alanine transaminase [Tribonema minus]|uniref:Alanine transaminase n=1 Tax=Tribonema minus TaxID=303371 RepID=A0A835ZD97_9STRA|nr:alanine transaminase [Tribonema minus]
MNKRVTQTSYAVRGRVLDASMRIQARMADGHKYPFDQIIALNIGNPQALEQPPLTFNRQVLSLCMYPQLLDTAPPGLFDPEAVERARKYVKCTSGGMGVYTNSQGMQSVREEVAAFIAQRDGHPARADRVFLTNGASEGVKLLMQCMLREMADGHADGMLTPIPQYPLYSATLTLLGGRLVPYHLVEGRNWGVSIEELRESLAVARDDDGVCVRGICIINPGNPTGSVLTEEQIADIIRLAVEENLVVIADEVYQANVWQQERPFVSFKKVACDLGYTAEPGDHRLQLVSFHSTSKGYMGECGVRGGYMELHGISDDIKAQLYKLASLSLCSNTAGQVMMGLMVNPPKEGDKSHALFAKERDAILDSMFRRAKLLSDALNTLEGVSCNSVDGALYAFPTITLSKKARDIAKERGIPADEYYCLEMLERAGIIFVPGSGFGQAHGTYHFRTTFLPPENKFPIMLERIKAGHASFMKDHA